MLFGLLVIVVPIFVLYEINKLFLTGGEDKLYSKSVLGVIAIATIGVFVLRVVSKIMLSNIHLMNSAQEKATMTNTYLALLENEKAITQEDRQVILQALFRPTMTGLIHGEELPSSLPETLLKTLGK